MADGGRVVLANIEESTWGTTPASALTKIANATSESFGMDTSTVLSNIIRGDYIRTQQIRTDAIGNAGFDFELAYGDLDNFVEAAMRTDWASAVATTGTISAADTGNKYTRGAGSFVSDGWVVGASGIAAGFGTAANNGYFVVTAVDATNLTVSGLDLADEAGGGDETLDCAGFCKNGTTLKSYTFERQFTDLTTTQFIAHKGVRIGSMSFSAATGQIITGSVAGTGKAPLAIASSTAGSGAYSASSGASNEIMNGVDHVTGIFEADSGSSFTSAVSYNVSQIDLNLGSPVRPINALGTLGPVAIGGNSFEITGTMRVYTDDNSKGLWDDYIAYTQKALWFRFVDSAGNGYFFYLPQVQFTASDGPNSSGPDSDVMQSINFTAEYDSSSASLATITRIAA